MTIQYSVIVRNAELDAIETAIATTPIMTINTGAAPINCAAANTGTILATLDLPSDWMLAAASGSKSKSGTWQETSADAAGVAAHFRVHHASNSNCHIQGTVTLIGGGGDMELDNTNIGLGQQVTISTFTITAGNS